MAADLLLAVDGGGTRTRAAVANLEGRVLARGFGPSSNPQNVGLEAVLRWQVRTQLLAALGGDIGPVNHVVDPVVWAVALARRLLRG